MIVLRFYVNNQKVTLPVLARWKIKGCNIVTNDDVN